MRIYLGSDAVNEDTKLIDAKKLKAAAEHLEWTLNQYPENIDVQGLLHALLPLIKSSVSGEISEPIDMSDIPCAYYFADGVYIPYKSPSVGEAYNQFATQISGGLSEQDQQQIARLDALRSARMAGDNR